MIYDINLFNSGKANRVVPKSEAFYQLMQPQKVLST